MNDIVGDDTVVLGSGPAGVALADGLLRRGRSVLLVESGVARERDTDRATSEGGDPRGVWGHEPLGEHRRRVLGGTSTAWGGRCIPLDPLDFEVRSWVPDSGWPISYDEYRRWLPEAARLLEIPAADFQREEQDPLFGRGTDIDGSPIELWSPPTNVSKLLARLQREHDNLTVIDDTHVTGIEFDPDGTILSLRAVQAGQAVRIIGRRYVLAAGALENARLLLASAVGASLPALGRYYMSHVFATHMTYTGRSLPAASGFFRLGRTYARHRWQLTPEAQRRRRVGNVIGFIARPPAHAVSIHLDPLTALVEAVKLVRRHIRSPRSLLGRRSDLAVYARVIARADPGIWPQVLLQSVRRGARNRLPMLLPPLNADVHHLWVQAEHLPHADSRVVLSERRDRFGTPLLETEIDFHRADFETVEAFHEAMEAFLGRQGYRAGRSPAAATRAVASDMVGGFNSNAHHIGTARMGTDIATSVVDPDCRVHGSANLFVAGSAVFPTSGHANPTLSIVALSYRLAEHLAEA
ncbi:GMC oxidoreductase [uncultured Amnibacterium sp.]|uniref:GMC oxidoreductase n=1 Tax=uncultured Amnibacterium sp. TaxID=1631851 RepID=UPI0035CA179D